MITALKRVFAVAFLSTSATTQITHLSVVFVACVGVMSSGVTQSFGSCRFLETQLRFNV